MTLIAAYARSHIAKGGRLHAITRHVLGLYHGEAGARGFRRALSELAARENASVDDLLEAVALVEAARERKAAA